MKVRKAVIPSAGIGTRLLPLSKSLPKEMLPVVDKPLIQYSVEEAAQSGIESIAVVISPGKSAVKDYFERNPELEQFLEEKGKHDLLKVVKSVSNLAQLSFISQPRALGLGHAILTAEEYVGQEPFAVLLPDDIFECAKPCLKQLIDAFLELKASVVVLGRVDAEGTKKCGIVRARKVSKRIFEISDLIEKPGPERAFSDLAVIGRYVFHPDIFKAIKQTAPDERGEIQITDAIKILCRMQPVYGYLFEGVRYECGDKVGFLEANIALALKNPEFSQKLREYLRSLRV